MMSNQYTSSMTDNRYFLNDVEYMYMALFDSTTDEITISNIITFYGTLDQLANTILIQY